jgi:hypothetical protein
MLCPDQIISYERSPLTLFLANVFAFKIDRPFGISQNVRSPFTPFSQQSPIALLE